MSSQDQVCAIRCDNLNGRKMSDFLTSLRHWLVSDHATFVSLASVGRVMGFNDCGAKPIWQVQNVREKRLRRRARAKWREFGACARPAPFKLNCRQNRDAVQLHSADGHARIAITTFFLVTR